MDESILGDMPQREEVNAILKEIKDAVPKVSVDELKDTSKRKLAIDAEEFDVTRHILIVSSLFLLPSWGVLPDRFIPYTMVFT